MKKLKELLREDFKVYGDINKTIFSFAYNSKEVDQNSVFIAISGLTTDGHIFIDEAIKKGAVAVVYETGRFTPHNKNITWIEVSDSRNALSWIASRFYDNPSKKLNLIGITGTNGKTTTSFIIHHILKKAGKKTGVIGTIKYIIDNIEKTAIYTTPEAKEFQSLLQQMLMQGVEYVVSEVSSHALALKRVDYTEFKIAVFTNLSRDHLDFHKDMESYFLAKRRLFTELLKENGFAIINIDDTYGRKLATELRKEKILYSLKNPEADLYVNNYNLKVKGTNIKIISKKNGKISINSPLIGIPNIYNTLAAVAVAEVLEVPLDIITEALKDFKAPPGRFETVDEGQKFLAVVDYAHTPDALERLLLSLKDLKEQISKDGKIITVFGCGGNRDRGKREQMGRIATELSDYVILTSDNPRWEEPRQIIKDIENGVSKTNYIVVLDRIWAIKIAAKLCQKGDILVVAGKGHEDYQEIKGFRYPFSDVEILRKAIRENVYS
ncbi:MAG: UDP-N-acetylmuramoyl-L-alanyl-D-glutamate--2,6-diaminopimelate ligase [Thermodesulfovibrio sp.]|nr:UDP-N-acetylmuramoyl-L-alanyl-D-glutamate--2,6-diaminopimelate ligase [Thermodesulfovibrio sp.]